MSHENKTPAALPLPQASERYYFLDSQGYLRQAYSGEAPAAPQNAGVGSWFNYRDKTYLAGLVIGVSLALVLSNPKVQKSLISGAVKCWNGVQGGVEEIKEKVKDAQAEFSRDK